MAPQCLSPDYAYLAKRQNSDFSIWKRRIQVQFLLIYIILFRFSLFGFRLMSIDFSVKENHITGFLLVAKREMWTFRILTPACVLGFRHLFINIIS